MALDQQTVHIPLAYGLQSKVDPRALSAPALAMARDVQFEELGGIQPRLPFEAMSLSIVGGGTVTEPRRLAVNGDELLLFTRTALYSWSESDQAWSPRGEYLAPDVQEEQVFGRSEDQIFADRAELDGVAVFSWVDRGAADSVLVAAIDTETGAVLLAPTTVAPAGQVPARPRLVAQATRVLLSWFDDTANNIRALQIDPGNVATSVAAGIAAPIDVAGTALASGNYDVVVLPSDGSAYFAVDLTAGNGYLTVRLTDAAVFTRVSKAFTALEIACALSPDGAQMFVVRYDDGANLIRADRHSAATLATNASAISLGAPNSTTVHNIACAFRSVQDSGQFRCYAWWSSGDLTAFSLLTELNFVDTNSTAGTKLSFARDMAVASRAFGHDGRVYVWLVFAGASIGTGAGAPDGFRAAVQNTYFLYRETDTAFDCSPIAKAASLRAGGDPAFEHLPGVQDLGEGEFVWCGTERQIIPIGEEQDAYSDRNPLAIRLRFDRDEARRCVRLGRTLYITGGQILQYDGSLLTEVGFHTFPYRLNAAVGAGGTLEAGTHAYRSTCRWPNAAGEVDRSTTATTATATVTAGQQVTLTAVPVRPTLKRTPLATPATFEVWRTRKNPSPPSPVFHRASSNDPAVNAGDNQYLRNSQSAATLTFIDDLVDADLALRETSQENGGVLPFLAPSPASIIEATQDRIILSGIADRPNAVHYSRLRNDGEVASFHGALRLELPPIGGRNTAVGFLNETMVVFQETAVFAVAGDGFGNVIGQGANYGPGRLISSDLGAESQEAVAFTPRGLLFKSRKGWYTMADWGAPKYVGADVAAFDDELVKAIQVVESQHHVRILTSGRMLIWDYEAGQWAEWPIADLAHGTLWRGQHVIVANDQVQAQADEPGAPVQLDVELAWIKLADLQGYQRIWELMLLAEFRSACRVRWRLKKDYDEDVYFQDKTMPVTTTVVGNRVQMRLRPAVQQCQAMKVRITVLHESLDQAPAGEGLRLTGLALQYGVKRGGLYKRLSAAQSG